jgi:hypothetical protein
VLSKENGDIPVNVRTEAQQQLAELVESLQKDISRTYQEFDYFTRESTMKMMQRILTAWAQGNPKMYRQGSHTFIPFNLSLMQHSMIASLCIGYRYA